MALSHLLTMLKAYGPVTAAELSELVAIRWDISPESVAADLAMLQDLGLASRAGHRRCTVSGVPGEFIWRAAATPPMDSEGGLGSSDAWPKDGPTFLSP